MYTISGFSLGLYIGGITHGRGVKHMRAVMRGLTAIDKVHLQSSSIGTRFPAMAKEYRLAIVVRQDLKMGKGKIAAQCSHASVTAYEQASINDPQTVQRWMICGQPKVILKCADEKELLALYQHAENLGLATSIIQDAGHTQIMAGSKTALGIGPATVDKISEVTGRLKLL